jgi:hypothetical protein
MGKQGEKFNQLVLRAAGVADNYVISPGARSASSPTSRV